MIIIMNPPYGKNSVLGRKIINRLTPLANQTVVLATVTAHKFTDYEHLQAFEELNENPFTDASFTGGLAISCYSNAKKGPFSKYEDFVYLKAPESVKTYLKYQQAHPRTYKLVRATFSTWHYTDEQVEEFAKQHDRNKIFVQTHWNVNNGVHEDDSAFDRAFNLFGKPFTRKTDCWFLEFETEAEAENIKKWYYSKGKKGLANKLYKDVIGSVHYFPADVLPNLDWSRPWTDREILAELNLPEDFLEDQ